MQSHLAQAAYERRSEVLTTAAELKRALPADVCEAVLAVLFALGGSNGREAKESASSLTSKQVEVGVNSYVILATRD